MISVSNYAPIPGAFLLAKEGDLSDICLTPFYQIALKAGRDDRI